MEYPIDQKAYQDLLSTRQQMVSLSPKSGSQAIACPFVPYIGRDILEGSRGIYFIGIATRGPWHRSDNLDQCQTSSNKHAADPDSGLFWRYVKAVTEAVFDGSYSESTDRIAWSNQFKIGLESGNPSGAYAKAQQELCKVILQRELQLASRCAVIFLGDPDRHAPILDGYFDRKSWDDETHKKYGVWLRYSSDGAPIFYHYHPRAFAPQKVQFDALVTRISDAIKRYLVTPQAAVVKGT
jgi:hypothetical protein